MTDVSISRNDGSINVTLSARVGYIDGWPEARDDLGLNAVGEPVAGVRIITENEDYRNDSDEYPAGYTGVVLQFESIDALKRTTNRLFDEANERFDYGMHREAADVQSFASALPTEYEVEQATS